MSDSNETHQTENGIESSESKNAVEYALERTPSLEADDHDDVVASVDDTGRFWLSSDESPEAYLWTRDVREVEA